MKPETWQEVRLNDVFEIQLGKMLNSQASAGPEQFPYLGNRHVQWGRINLDELPTMHFDGNERNKFQLRPGDLLVCEGGEVGRTAVWHGQIDSCFFQKALHRLRPRNGAVVPEFMLHWMCFAAQRGRFIHLTGVSSIPHLTREKLGLVVLTLPTLFEQKKIAAILSSVDDAIEATQAVIDQLQVVKKAMMSELLTRGLPGRHTRFKQTEIGEVPEEWEVVTAAEVTERIVVGIVIKPASYYVPTGVPALRSKNVRADRLDLRDLVFISSESNELLSKSKLRAGDVVTVRTGDPGVSCVVPADLDGANCIDLILSTPKLSRIIGSFLSRLMNSHVGSVSVALRKGGLTQQHFNVGAMKDTLLPIPSIEEQHQIVATLDVVDERVRVEVEHLTQMATVKSALMSVLLTGELRVTPDEALA